MFPSSCGSDEILRRAQDDNGKVPSLECTSLHGKKSELEFPSAATFRADELLREIGVDDLHIRAIPIEFLSQASGDISQE